MIHFPSLSSKQITIILIWLYTKVMNELLLISFPANDIMSHPNESKRNHISRQKNKSIHRYHSLTKLLHWRGEKEISGPNLFLLALNHMSYTEIICLCIFNTILKLHSMRFSTDVPNINLRSDPPRPGLGSTLQQVVLRVYSYVFYL